MKIVKILGGLGNQMFQYALFLALQEKFPNERILVDYSYFRTYHVHTGLELQRVFGVDLPQAAFGELLKVTWPVYSFKLSRAIRKSLPTRKTECIEAKDYTFNEEVFGTGDKYYDGYWQNYLYFDTIVDKVRDTFCFQLPLNEKNTDLIQSLQNEKNTVSVHIRRGDYLKAKNYAGLCGIGYYQAAIDYVIGKIPNPHFYLFSDDMDWCKEYIVPLFSGNPYSVVDWNKGQDSPIDMQLMSACNHNIIANSSFSWWAAYLNKHSNKIVCAPEKWTNTRVNCKFQLPDWKLF